MLENLIIAQMENLDGSIYIYIYIACVIQAMDLTVALPIKTINSFWIQSPPGTHENLWGQIWLWNS